jgi:hypothetical protein
MAKKATCHNHNYLEEILRWIKCQEPYFKWEMFLYLLTLLSSVQLWAYDPPHTIRPSSWFAKGKKKTVAKSRDDT